MGLVSLAAGLFFFVAPATKGVSFVLAGIALVTAFTGFCPLNKLIGLNTCRSDRTAGIRSMIASRARSRLRRRWNFSGREQGGVHEEARFSFLGSDRSGFRNGSGLRRNRLYRQRVFQHRLGNRHRHRRDGDDPFSEENIASTKHSDSSSPPCALNSLASAHKISRRISVDTIAESDDVPFCSSDKTEGACHWAPVLRIQSTASKTRRVATGLRPGRPSGIFSSGKCWRIFSH